MKAFMLTLVASILLVTTTTQGQDNWASYSVTVPVEKYQTKKFRLSASIKVDALDKESSASLWARVDNKGGATGFSNDPSQNPVTSSEWKDYKIEGTIDEDGDILYVGIILTNNGNYYVDDIRVEIETAKNKWASVFIEDFEDGKHELVQGIKANAGAGKSDNFSASITREVHHNGMAGLAIAGKGIIPYGHNNAVGKFANVNGVKIYYEVYGEGAPLVVLHGNGGSISNAASHYPELVSKYKVIAIDNRGQGQSTDTNAPLTYEMMASDIKGVLDELKIDSAFIWGQSDGAILGLILAMEYPAKVRKVVAYGSNVQPDSTAVFSWALAFLDRSLKSSDNPKETKLIKLMQDHPNISFRDLGRIKAPVLLMAGDRDVIRPEHTVKMFQNIPNSHLCILPGSTHGGAWENKELFLQIMNNFFQKPFTKPDTRSWFD